MEQHEAENLESSFMRRRPSMRPLGLSLVLACSLLPAGVIVPQIARPIVMPADSFRVSAPRLSFFSCAAVASGVAVHFARYYPLWQDHYTSFFFREDYTYARNQDKLLHFYGSGIGSVLSTKSLSWSGYDDDDAAIFGAATSLAFFTFMKIEDGHINYIGFDRVDELANVLGAGYPLAQHYVPWLNSFTPKASVRCIAEQCCCVTARAAGVS